MPKIKCENCGREVDEIQIDRFWGCNFCRAEERATNMGVGNLKTK